MLTLELTAKESAYTNAFKALKDILQLTPPETDTARSEVVAEPEVLHTLRGLWKRNRKSVDRLSMEISEEVLRWVLKWHEALIVDGGCILGNGKGKGKHTINDTTSSRPILGLKFMRTKPKKGEHIFQELDFCFNKLLTKGAMFPDLCGMTWETEIQSQIGLSGRDDPSSAGISPFPKSSHTGHPLAALDISLTSNRSVITSNAADFDSPRVSFSCLAARQRESLSRDSLRRSFSAPAC